MQPKRSRPHSTKSDADVKEPAANRARRHYQSPAWEVEEVFEKSALACGKVISDHDGCAGNLSS